MKAGDIVKVLGRPLHSSRSGDLGAPQIRCGAIGIVQVTMKLANPAGDMAWVLFPHTNAPDRKYCLWTSRLKKMRVR